MTGSEVEREVWAQVDAAREQLVGLCRELVAAPSANPPGDTRAVADAVARYLGGHDVAAERVAADPAMPNVLVVSAGARPGPHLVLNVHLDTMPAGDESAWSVPVHRLTRRDGRLYGLGMGNMKGAVAAMALAFRLLHERREQWGGRLTFTGVSDECVFGDAGAAYLLEQRPAEVTGDALICGEGPGFRRLGLAEKGVAWYEVTATAAPAHSSRARTGATATARLAAAVLALDALNERVADPPPGLAGIPAGDVEALRLSVNVGTLAGGTFVSQVATRATAYVDARVPPGLSLAELEAELDRRLAGCYGVSWRRVKGWEPNWSGLDDPFVALMARAAADVRGEPAVPTVRLPASDASRWRARGVPAVCYGPQPTLSAGVDDYAAEDEVLACAKLYATTALRFLGAW